MKKLFVLSAVVLGSWTAQAQQLPLISNYLNTAYLFNPAYSGIEGKTEISVLNRRQYRYSRCTGNPIHGLQRKS